MALRLERRPDNRPPVERLRALGRKHGEEMLRVMLEMKRDGHTDVDERTMTLWMTDYQRAACEAYYAALSASPPSEETN